MAELPSLSGFGTVVLAVALVVAAYGAVSAALGARRASPRLVRSAEQAVYAGCALLTLASLLLIYAFVSHDYSIRYVHRYSDETMPLVYLVASYWGGLDGSLLLWAFLLALFSAVAVRTNRERDQALRPWVMVVLQAVLSLFLLLLLFERNPFSPYLPGAALPHYGRGLNPLLQNPYMVTHPPALYLGLVGMTVPYAFGLAALISGRLDEAWLSSVRRWIVVSWLFLTTGLILGAIWAYEELGWGGYWAWDPVENAGLFPWLTATALLHSLMIQERRGMLKVWNIALVVVTFFLTIVATFMTRSGVVQSVHAFAQDTRLALIFGALMVAVVVVSLVLILWRLPRLRSRHQLDSLLSRETAFLINNWVLLCAALFVVVGTLWPTLTELFTGERVTMGSAFFNRWLAPIGWLLLFLKGVGPLIAWRHASPGGLLRQLLWPTVAGLVVVAAVMISDLARGTMPAQRLHSAGVGPLLTFGLVGLVLATIIQELWRGTAIRRRQLQVDRLTALVGLVTKRRRRYGGYLVHGGVALMFLGFAGGAFKQEVEVSLTRGQSVAFAGYTVTLEGVVAVDDAQKSRTTAVVTISHGGRPQRRMAPARWRYHKHRNQPTTEVDIWRRWHEDLYLILAGFDAQSQRAMLKLVCNPLISWLWLGYVLLVLGTAITLLPDPRPAPASPRHGDPAPHRRAGRRRMLWLTAGLVVAGGWALLLILGLRAPLALSTAVLWLAGLATAWSGVGLVAVTYTASGPGDARPHTGSAARRELLREKGALLAALKELDFDRRMGKLSAADYDAIVTRYRRRAVAVLQRLEERVPSYRELIEEELARRRRALGTRRPATALDARRCHACQQENDHDASFCKRCGRPLTGEEAPP